MWRSLCCYSWVFIFNLTLKLIFYFSVLRRSYRITFLYFLLYLFLGFLFCLGISTEMTFFFAFSIPLPLFHFFFSFFPPKISPHISRLISVSFITYLVHYILLTLGKYYQKPRTREINGLDKDYKKMGQERLPSKKFLSVDFLELQYRLGIAKPTYLLLFCLELPKNLTM